MGRMLDALRRIDGERRVPSSERSAQSTECSKSIPERPGPSTEGRVPSAKYRVPRTHPTTAHTSEVLETSEVLGKVLSTECPRSSSEDSEPILGRAGPNAEVVPGIEPSVLSTEHSARSAISRPRPAKPEQPPSAASRWWKTPPPPSAVRDLDPAGADNRPVKKRETSLAAAGSVRKRRRRLRKDRSARQTRLTNLSFDVIPQWLTEFPPGRSAVLLLCDPEPVDVSPAVAALAVALASQVTGQVIAVDGTFGDTELARLLGAKPDADLGSRMGLGDLLSGKVALKQAVRGTRVPNLDMLLGQAKRRGWDNESPCSPADRWAAALRQFRQQYQFVLIGASPGNSGTAPMVARWADAVYLLVRAGQTGHRAAKQTASMLRQFGGRVLGCLLIEHSV